MTPMVITENGTTTNGPAIEGENGFELGPSAETQAAMYLVEHLWEIGRYRGRDGYSWILPLDLGG